MTSLLSISLFAPSLSHLNNEKLMLLNNNIIFKTENIEGMFLNFKFNQRENYWFSMSVDPFCHTLAQNFIIIILYPIKPIEFNKKKTHENEQVK